MLLHSCRRSACINRFVFWQAGTSFGGRGKRSPSKTSLIQLPCRMGWFASPDCLARSPAPAGAAPAGALLDPRLPPFGSDHRECRELAARGSFRNV